MNSYFDDPKHVVLNPPDFDDLKTSLKTKGAFDSKESWEDFRWGWRGVDKPMECTLSENEKTYLESIGCKIEDYVYDCGNCGHCDNCKDLEIEELMEGLSDTDKNWLKTVEGVYNDYLNAKDRLSEKARKVWDRKHPVCFGPTA